MSTMSGIATEFPVSIELGKAVVTKTAAEAVRLTFHVNQHERLNRVQRLAAALIVEMEQVRDTPMHMEAGPDNEVRAVPGPWAGEATTAIKHLQTAVFWCAQAVIKTI